MSAPRDPRDPSAWSDIAAAAQRARERLHKEIEQLREGLEEMLVEEGSVDKRGFRANGISASLLTSVALLGVIAVASLALLLYQGRSQIGGNLGSLRPSGDDSAGTEAKIGAAQVSAAGLPVRSQIAQAPQYVAIIPSGGSASGGSGLTPSYRLIVNDLVPVSSGRNKPPGHGHPGPRPHHQAPPSPSPPPQPETTQLVSLPLPEQGETPSPGHGGKDHGDGHDGGKTPSRSDGDRHNCDESHGDGHGNPGDHGRSHGGEGHGNHGDHGEDHGNPGDHGRSHGGEGHGDDEGAGGGSHDNGHGGDRSHASGHDSTESPSSPPSPESAESHGNGHGRPSSPPPAPVPPATPPPAESEGPGSASNGAAASTDQGSSDTSGHGKSSGAPGHSGK